MYVVILDNEIPAALMSVVKETSQYYYGEIVDKLDCHWYVPGIVTQGQCYIDKDKCLPIKDNGMWYRGVPVFEHAIKERDKQEKVLVSDHKKFMVMQRSRWGILREECRLTCVKELEKDD